MGFVLDGVGWNLDAVKKYKSEESFINTFLDSNYKNLDEDKRKELLAKVYSQAHPKKEAKVATKKKSATKKKKSTKK